MRTAGAAGGKIRADKNCELSCRLSCGMEETMAQAAGNSKYAGTQTEKNLEAAIAGESVARNIVNDINIFYLLFRYPLVK